MRLVRGAVLALMVLALPVFLITTNARIVIFSGWLYSYGFDKYEIAAVTDIEEPQLMRVAGEIKDYFTNDQEFISTPVVMRGVERQLYKDREVLHMVDVKGLVKKVLLLQKISLVVLLGAGFAALAALGNRAGGLLAGKGVLWGSIATVGVIVVAGLGSLADFESLFILFHHLSFTNDLWLLDPRTDYLLMMFPEGFFLDATYVIGALSLAQVVLAGTAAGGYLWRTKRTETPEKKRPRLGDALY